MSDNNNLTLSIIAVVSGISAAFVLILKHIKKSECSACCKIQTRTPITLAPPPSHILQHNTHTTKNISTNNNNNITTTITEIDV